MSVEESHVEVQKGSDRNFGLIFAVVFLLLGLFPVIAGAGVRWWSVMLAAVFLVVALVRPSLLAKLNTGWFKLGLALGAIVSPVVLFVVFCLTIIPLGVVMRLLGKDLLNLKINKNAESYWITRVPEAHQSMKNQF